MAGWTHTIRHPWLDPPIGKRRLADEEDDPHTVTCLPFKRRKHHTLEHGFACLTLDRAALTPSPSPLSLPLHLTPQVSVDSTNISASHNADVFCSSTFDVLALPTSLQRYTSLESDVEMDVEYDSSCNSLHDTASAWPAAFRSPKELGGCKTEEPQQIKEVEISPVLLGHLKHQPNLSPIIPITSPSTAASSSKALVLYRPLCPSSPTRSPRRVQEDNNNRSGGDDTVNNSGRASLIQGENEMDVEV